MSKRFDATTACFAGAIPPAASGSQTWPAPSNRRPVRAPARCSTRAIGGPGAAIAAVPPPPRRGRGPPLRPTRPEGCARSPRRASRSASQASAVTKVHALHLAGNAKAAAHLLHEGAALRVLAERPRDGRYGETGASTCCGTVGVLRGVERRRRMTLGLLSSQAGSHILLRLEMCFGARDRRLRRVQVRRGRIGCAGCFGGGNCLPRIAHFLYGRAARAADQASDADKYCKEAQHSCKRH